jgi:hypothetical protein
VPYVWKGGTSANVPAHLSWMQCGRFSRCADHQTEDWSGRTPALLLLLMVHRGFHGQLQKVQLVQALSADGGCPLTRRHADAGTC